MVKNNIIINLLYNFVIFENGIYNLLVYAQVSRNVFDLLLFR